MCFVPNLVIQRSGTAWKPAWRTKRLFSFCLKTLKPLFANCTCLRSLLVCFLLFTTLEFNVNLHKPQTPPPCPLHTLCLKVRLVPVNFEDPQFAASYQQSVALYARYQMAIHGDDPSACSETEVLHDYYLAQLIGSHWIFAAVSYRF